MIPDMECSIFAMARSRAWVLLVVVFIGVLGSCSAQFLNGFYHTRNCPSAEAIVTQAVTEAFNQDPSIAPALIRMLFHDCFVEVT
jgi:peroxidase